MMDAQSLDQQQTEFLSALFPPDDIAQPQNGDHQMSIFEFTPQSSQQQQQQPPSIPINHNPNLNIQLEQLGDMMALQGIESPTSLTQFSPHLLLEQQFKLSQLQQLQQLQNQIFQQQASLLSSPSVPTVYIYVPLNHYSISSKRLTSSLDCTYQQPNGCRSSRTFYRASEEPIYPLQWPTYTRSLEILHPLLVPI
jgi:hypothetical protein